MKKCDAYHTRTKTTYLDPATVAYITGKWPENNGKIESEVGVCCGTKNQEECNCGGNRSKYDFYKNVRENTNYTKNEDNESYYIFYSKKSNPHENADDVAITEAKNISEALNIFSRYFKNANENCIQKLDLHREGYVQGIQIVSEY